MKRQTKLTSQHQAEEQQHIAGLHAEKQVVREFATPEELLRHDALHTPVPPNVAHRLRESIGEVPAPSRAWWRRALGL
jgi:hypothetical protein